MSTAAARLGPQPVATARPAARSAVFQIPRNALALLMMAQLAVILPHMGQLPFWIVGVGLFCGFWRTQIFRGRWEYPSATVKALMVLGSVVSVASMGRAALGLEGATSLLLLSFALKLVEMKTRRDAILVIFLCYFVIATQFLFDQALVIALYEMLALVLVTAALVGLNQVHATVQPMQSLRIAGSLIAQALPLTLVMFLFFPRVGPIGTLDLPGSSRTGISDRMKPGDVATLTRSDELAFRVAFKDRLPPADQLYFRGLVYPHFVAGEWRKGTRESGVAPDARDLGERSITYDVLLQPTASEWLFALNFGLPRSGKGYFTPYHTLEADSPVHTVLRYRIESFTDYRLDATGLPDAVRQESLAIDRDRNQRLQAQAQAWLTELGGDVDAFIARIAEYVRNEPYVYTLSPATLPELDSVDRFWFDTREGFCTHYAGATVLLLRAAGVPARMVGGYLGGAVNRITGHLEVRQYDAHAWVEYWLPQQGWLRFDPTAAVAPERIRSGLSAALSQEDRAQLSLFAAARFGGEGLVGTVLQWADSLEHRWNLFVVGFDASQQKGVLARLLGEVTPQRIVIGMLAGGGMCLALVSLVLFWRIRQPARPPLEAAFDALTQAAARVGVVRQADESPAAFLRRLAVVEEGGWESYGGTVEGLQQHFYDPTAEHDGAVLLRELRRWRLRLLLRRR